MTARIVALMLAAGLACTADSLTNPFRDIPPERNPGHCWLRRPGC